MSDNTNNGFPVPEEPLTREEQYLSAIAGVTSSSDIPEEPLTRIEAYLNKIVENGGGGGGGTSDYTQLSNKPKINNTELDGNKTSADFGLQDTVAFEGTYNSSSNKAATMADIKDGKLTGYAQSSGNVAATDKVIEAIGKVEKKADDNQSNISLIEHESGTKLFFTETEPTGDITEGSYWISSSGNKVYTMTSNLYTGLNETTGKIFEQSGGLVDNVNYNISDYIEIDDTKNVVYSFNNTLQSPSRQQYSVIWYNSSYGIVYIAPIAPITDMKKYIFTYAPVSGAKYVRINYRVSDTDMTVVQSKWE